MARRSSEDWRTKDMTEVGCSPQAQNVSSNYSPPVIYSRGCPRAPSHSHKYLVALSPICTFHFLASDFSGKIGDLLSYHELISNFGD
uniref:Uncharacterized protein n=1 Tax=Aegilops tauschii subsp. strangulata TaxID=200361 RepID=A0A453N522_AEGTS